MNRRRELHEIQRWLATARPFGAAAPVRERVADLYRFIAEVVGHPVPDDAAVRDPTLRIALNGALHALRTDAGPPPAGAPLLEEMTVRLHPAAGDPVTCWSPRSGGGPGATPFAGFFQAKLAETGLPGAAEPVPPTEAQAGVLTAALDLLHCVLPDLTASAMAHVALLVCVRPSDGAAEGIFESASYDEIPGVVFLGPAALTSAESTAEAVLHEALHQKLTDLRFTHELLRPGYDHATAATVHAPWTRTRSWNSAWWDVDRALAACHVYTHLAVLRLALGRAAEARTALDRARYLARELGVAGTADLGPAGRDLVAWLGRCADEIARRLFAEGPAGADERTPSITKGA